MGSLVNSFSFFNSNIDALYYNAIEVLIIVAAVLLAIMLHEIAHGLIAFVNGDPTAKNQHRLTLNPFAHFDAVGFIMLVILKFGYAKPVPVNPNNFENKKVGMFTVSLAGIATNLVLAFLCYPLLYVTYDIPYLYTFIVYFISVNLNLAIFNFLPLYPLDGYRLVNCFASSENKIMKFLHNYSKYVIVFLLGLGIIRDLFAMPLYWDPLSWLIITVKNFLIELFDKFWMLFL